MKYPVLAATVAAVFVTGCGGGGGGGSSDSPSYIRSTVPFATPVRVESFQPLEGTGVSSPILGIYAQDLNSDDSDEVVVAGRLTQPATPETWRDFNMQVFGWNTGEFALETSSWFAAGENTVTGTEPSVKFADFNGDGHVDMSIAPGTDMNTLYAEGWVYFNSGSSSFSRTQLNIPDTWAHGSWAGDINGDGFADLVVTDYGNNLSVTYGSADGTLTSYTTGGISTEGLGGTTAASSVSVADYLGDGTMTMILTDSAASEAGDVALYSFSTDSGSLVLTKEATLPASRFLLSKYDSARAESGQSDGHQIRNFSMDFNDDGLMDVVVIDNLSGNGVEFSEVQFLRNDGSGTFIDVTDTLLVDYDTSIGAAYEPRLTDVNGDGLDDILLSTPKALENSTDYHDTTRVLVQTADGKFVQKYESVFSDFSNQIQNSTADALDWTQKMNIARGPDGVNYLFGMVLTDTNNTVEAVPYLARIGTAGTVTPQSVAEVISSTWTYLNPPEVNQVLARTSPLSLQDTPVVDLDSALNPVGALAFSLDGRDGQRIAIQGHLALPSMNTSIFRSLPAVDEIGRHYMVDASAMASVADTTATARPDFVSSTATSWASNFVSDSLQTQSYAFGDNDNYSLGFSPRVNQHSETRGWSYGASITQMSGSPWFSFSGAFGDDISSTITEANLQLPASDDITVQIGVMHTDTEFTQGLVRDIDSVWSAYAFATRDFGNLSLSAGMEPTHLSGKMTLELPEAVTSDGVMHYQQHTIAIRNEQTLFISGSQALGSPLGELELRFYANTNQQGSALLFKEVEF